MKVPIITVLTAESVTGKRYSLIGGELEKKAVAYAKGSAVSVAVNTAEELLNLLREVTESPNKVLIPGAFVGSKIGEPFDIVYEKELREWLGPDGKGDVSGLWHGDDGERPRAARVKGSVEPSVWQCLDCDTPPGMPPELAGLDIAGRLELLEKISPGISRCERVEERSASARIVAPGSAPKGASHAWIRISDPALLDAWRNHMRIEAPLHGASFPVSRRSTATGEAIGKPIHLTLIDLVVLTAGRLVFCSRPQIGRTTMAGWKVADAGVRIVNPGGGVLDISRMGMPTQDRLAAHHEATGECLDITRDGKSLVVDSYGTITLDMPIEAKNAPVSTIGEAWEWLKRQPKGTHVRCQSPFRESTSWAAYVNLGHDGKKPFLHDSGTSTNYWLTDEIPAHVIDRLRKALTGRPGAAAGPDAGEAPRGSGEVPGLDGTVVAPDHEVLTPAGSEDAIALAVVTQHHHELRYVAQRGRWFRWDGCRWGEDRTVAIFDLIRPYVREAALSHRNEGQQRSAARAAIVAGVEKYARSDRRVAALADDFDRDPYLLNTPDGMVDLSTGQVRPCDPAEMCSKAAAVGPAPPGTPAPRFEQFLQEVTGNDADAAEKRSYMQRLAGYALIGGNPEQVLFFGEGSGANGKGVFVNTMRDVMADYCVVASAELFLASRFERHPTELADLRGARLVVASELNQGQRWNEARIKSLTGNDPVKARFMAQDFFEYKPQFKPLVIGNHRPGLRNIDEAIKRRLQRLPFTIKIPAERRDTALPEKLKAEWPAILRWAIDGCLAWQRTGLAPPRCVTEATAEYMDEQDLFGQWMEDCCRLGADLEVSSTALFTSWCHWANIREEYVGTHKIFSQTLRERGFSHGYGRNGAVFRGLDVRPLLNMPDGVVANVPDDAAVNTPNGVVDKIVRFNRRRRSTLAPAPTLADTKAGPREPM